MKKNKAKKKLIRAYSIIALMVLSTFAWTMTNGAGHGVTITKPENNSIYNNLYNKARVTTEKTTFIFYPVVVHLVGFWLYEEDKAYSHIVDIMPFKDLLWSENAHFLHGYSYTTGFWKPEDPQTIYQNYLAPQEDSNDIDILMFSSHGTKKLGIHAMETTNISSYADPNDSTAEYFGKWLKRTSLKNAINSAHLDSSTILLIIDCCYAEMFNDAFTDNNNIIVLASCKEDEESWGHPTYYDASYSLYKKLENIDSYFLRALALALYDENNLYDAFSHLADYDWWYSTTSTYKTYGPIHDKDQFPVSLHLSYPKADLTFYIK